SVLILIMLCCSAFLLSLAVSSFLSLSVFFSRYALLRDLHSFPTRRSSDLGRRFDHVVFYAPGDAEDFRNAALSVSVFFEVYDQVDGAGDCGGDETAGDVFTCQ